MPEERYLHRDTQRRRRSDIEDAAKARVEKVRRTEPFRTEEVTLEISPTKEASRLHRRPRRASF